MAAKHRAVGIETGGRIAFRLRQQPRQGRPALRIERSLQSACRMDNLTPPRLAPISPRRNANKFLKHPVQLGCIAKPYRVRHVNNRQVLY